MTEKPRSAVTQDRARIAVTSATLASATQFLQDPSFKSQPCLRVPQRQSEDLHAEEHRTAREPCGMNSPVFQGIVGETDRDGEVVQSEQHPSVCVHDELQWQSVKAR